MRRCTVSQHATNAATDGVAAVALIASSAATSTGSASADGTRPSGARALWRVLAWLVILASVLVILRAVPIAQALDVVQGNVSALGNWGPVVFGAAYFLAAVLFVPGSALTLAAGAIFGLGVGTATASVSSTAAAAASFLIARYLAREKVRTIAETSRTFGAIDRAIARGGWKIIALLRLSPAVPFSLGNYLFGLTPVRFWPYLLATWVAMLPGTLLYVYLGFIGRTAAGSVGRTDETSPAQLVLLGVGLLATVIVSLYVTRLARKALEETPLKSEPNEQSAHSTSSGAKPIGKLIAAAGVLATLAACAQLNSTRLGSLFGPPKVTLQETYKNTAASATFDHSAFDALLRAHVHDGGLVDYVALEHDAGQLDAYIAAVGTADIDQLGRDERLALLINAYNAFTLRLILDHYPIASIKDIPFAQRWDARRWNIGGHTWSLNQIEHEQIRPHFAEPRIHFALVCAAIGCPPLRAEAYEAERMEAQLEAQARYVHADARWFRLDSTNAVAHVTSLYDWYGSDFEQTAGSVVAFAARYSPSLARALDDGRMPAVRFLDYDWSLNQQEAAP